MFACPDSRTVIFSCRLAHSARSCFPTHSSPRKVGVTLDSHPGSGGAPTRSHVAALSVGELLTTDDAPVSDDPPCRGRRAPRSQQSGRSKGSSRRARLVHTRWVLPACRFSAAPSFPLQPTGAVPPCSRRTSSSPCHHSSHTGVPVCPRAHRRSPLAFTPTPVTRPLGQER